ncbi:hypothetical protein diail_7715 [Diaporthe ilicicola]|nr:hypothetical protein diail_7715 [Diaporthe ilicicola]
MPPPAIAKVAVDQKGLKNGGAGQPSRGSKMAGHRVQKPTRFERFSRFPEEIKQMIWREAVQKPSCHTFKFQRRQQPPYGPGSPWTVDLAAVPALYDPSAYRRWKPMLWNRSYQVAKIMKSKKGFTYEEPKLDRDDLKKWRTEVRNLVGSKETDPDEPPKTNAKKSEEAFSKLANSSFQTGFRSAMVQFQPIVLKSPSFYEKAAAIDVATDLVIIELERGETAPASAWFDHSTRRMQINTIRHRMRHFRRVAVHYKKSHTGAGERGPFQCYCPAGPAGAQWECHEYKACPLEQACFLDCFPNLEEFYYVAEVSHKQEMAWCVAFRDHARRQDFKLRTSGDPRSASFKLAHFYDTKKEYLQLCPKSFVEFLPRALSKPLPQRLRSNRLDPPEAMGKPHECLVKVMETYKSKRGTETFRNSLEQRKKVKFGILLAYDLKE